MITGKHSTPPGTVIKAWKTGTVIASAVVDVNGDFLCSFTHDEETIILDSIRFTNRGYQTEVYPDIELVSGPTRFIVQLSEAAFEFFLYGNDSSPEGMFVEVWYDSALIAMDQVDFNGRYSCTFEHDEEFIEIDTIKYYYKHYDPIMYLNTVLTTSTENDVTIVLPKCEVEQFGTVILSNDTGDSLYVDCTYRPTGPGLHTLLQDGESQTYQMDVGVVLIWGSIDGEVWQQSVYDLTACENLYFLWQRNGKKSSSELLAPVTSSGRTLH